MTEKDPAGSAKPRRNRPARGFWRGTGKRIAVGIAGFAILIGGVILALPLVPGPGALLIIAGLALLATEFAWADRLLERARGRFEDAARQAGVKPKHAAIAGLVVVVAVAAVGTWLALR